MKLKLQLLNFSRKKNVKCSIVATILDKAENMSVITENFSR